MISAVHFTIRKQSSINPSLWLGTEQPSLNGSLSNLLEKELPKSLDCYQSCMKVSIVFCSLTNFLWNHIFRKGHKNAAFKHPGVI